MMIGFAIVMAALASAVSLFYLCGGFATAKVGEPPAPGHWPAPWWYRLLARIAPGRCREIPEAANPDRIVLRQFAIVKRYVYLQQFASGEDRLYMHSHPYRFMIALGLWGAYTERRIAGETRTRIAPYLYTMDGGHVHHVQNVTPGHTSIFAGFGRAADGSAGDKRYFGTPVDLDESRASNDDHIPHEIAGAVTFSRLWSKHIQKFVERI